MVASSLRIKQHTFHSDQPLKVSFYLKSKLALMKAATKSVADESSSVADDRHDADRDAQPETTAVESSRRSPSERTMPIRNKFIVFVVFPTVVGLTGMYLGYLDRRNRQKGEISFDSDFVMPFLLALAMTIVIYLQTNGFSRGQAKPLIQWPRVKRIKKVVYKNKKGEIISPPPSASTRASQASQKSN